LGNDWWSVSDYAFNTLLAATYSFGDRKLYILDRAFVTDANGNVTDVARLVRIDLQSNKVESLGTWPYTAVYTQFALVNDVDGSVLLVASNSSSTVIGKLAVSSSGTAYATVVDSSESGNLSFAPVVDPGGYAVTTTAAQTGAPTTRRYTQLPYGAPGTYALDSTFFPQPIANGGFESGTLASWTATGASETVSTTSVHSGTYSAMLGSTSATNGDSTIKQSFTVPAGGGSLQFWYSNVCPDSVTYDWFTASLLGPQGQTLATIVPHTCAASSTWTKVILDLSPWEGSSVTVALTSHDDNYPGDPTRTFVDDVAVVFPQPIANGGFETGTLSSWTTRGASETISSNTFHSGLYSTMLGSTSATNGDSTVQQSFTVPAAGGTLQFWYSNVCPDSVTYDWFTATLLNAQGQTVATIVPHTCASSSAWTPATLDLSSWAGSNVTVVLTSHDDNYPGDPTYTYVDDVIVN